MQDTNIELIEQARNYLEESQHEACFGALDTFFKKIQVPLKSPIHQLHNQLRVVKTRYKNLIQQNTQGTISNEDYNVNFNNISLALYAFFDSIIDEPEHLTTPKTVKEGTLQNNIVNIILVLNGNFDDFSDENAIEITNKIRSILGIKEEEFRYINIGQGSILIHIKAKRNYELLIKLKSLVEVNVIDNLIVVKCDDILMDRFCTAMKNLKLNLSGADLSKKVVKVLFAEDNSLNQIVTPKILNRWINSISVDIADNGKIAIEKFENNLYDIVLMNLQMPVMNGFEASVRIRTIDAEVPIIALSANKSKREVEKCFANGINDYLVTPYYPEELKNKIMPLVYKKQLQRK